VGLTHARRGNPRGAIALLRRGAVHVAEFVDAASAVDAALLDPYSVAAQATALALRIERDGLGGVPEADLRLRLSPGPS
jgi:hypothetical protein